MYAFLCQLLIYICISYFLLVGICLCEYAHTFCNLHVSSIFWWFPQRNNNLLCNRNDALTKRQHQNHIGNSSRALMYHRNDFTNSKPHNKSRDMLPIFYIVASNMYVVAADITRLNGSEDIETNTPLVLLFFFYFIFLLFLAYKAHTQTHNTEKKII